MKKIEVKLEEPVVEEIKKHRRTKSYLEENLTALAEIEKIINKFPSMSLGQIMYNVTPNDCITMGDLFNLNASSFIESCQKLKGKRLKDEVTYGE